MAANDALLSELMAAAGTADTDIGERSWRRLMLAATTNVYQKVNEMDGIKDRIKRLEWIVGIAVAILSIAAVAIINGIVSGRIIVTIAP